MTATPCLACDPTAGRRPLPGGHLHATRHWVVEHCIGPLGVGTLVVKPLRHCTAVASLTPDEAAELGPLLHAVSRCVHDLNRADQVYVCLWSHAGWEAVHIHFVVQPAWRHPATAFPHPGPTLQHEMFLAGVAPTPTRSRPSAAGRRRGWRGRHDASEPRGRRGAVAWRSP